VAALPSSRSAATPQVVLLPDGGQPVNMPVLLLALYSPLFDDMFQDMLGEKGADGGGGSARVPLPDVSAPALAVALRWVAGLASLQPLAPAQLADVFRWEAGRSLIAPATEGMSSSLHAWWWGTLHPCLPSSELVLQVSTMCYMRERVTLMLPRVCSSITGWQTAWFLSR
jgi:hypothetical protein